MEDEYISKTESLCPICLKKISAKRQLRDNDVFLVKTCEDHGVFSTILWRGKPAITEWQRPKTPAHPTLFYGNVEKGCPFDCGLCESHQQIPCSVLLEVTNRCNLHCAVCFADSGQQKSEDISLEKIECLLERAIAAAGPSNLQLSGGEPTLRNDLPEIVKTARQVGYSFIQVNTNGLRLASDRDFVGRLQDAGLSSVFLQFDGVNDEIYRTLRGRALLDLKLQAVTNCGAAGIGVVFVPTLVKGVNTSAVGDIVRQGLQMAPIVRGIHFQPVSYFGRFPGEGSNERRFTLPELMVSLEDQTAGLLKLSDFSPPGCEHAHCSFHATYIRGTRGQLRLIGAANSNNCCSVDFGEGGVRKTVETVSRRWSLPTPASSSNPFRMVEEPPCCSGIDADEELSDEPIDLDVFLHNVATRSFTISAMAFQDADNLDLERLRGCCISVVSHDGRLIPFCAYNLTSRDGKSLYRNNRPSPS
jgi:7,8-dihydro-6-hydroxymethylpterin dimethyltransferase